MTAAIGPLSMSLGILLLIAPVLAQQGYSLSLTQRGALASTRRPTLDPNNVQLATLAGGFTWMAWLRFNDLTPSRMQINWAMGTQLDGNFFQPFAGIAGGYSFGGSFPAMASLTADKGANWHHYALSWDSATGARVMYIDGVAGTALPPAGGGQTFLDQDAYMVIGANTYPSNWLQDDYTSSNPAMTFDGEMDDLALWAGTLSAADVATVASKHGSTMLGATVSGTSPVFLYTFDEPLVDGTSGHAYVQNKGTAKTSSDYDMVMGRLPKPVGQEVFGNKLLIDGQSAPVYIAAPMLIPSSRTGGNPDSSAPFVVVAAAGETVTLMNGNHGVSYSATMPNPFTATNIGTDGGGKTVHVMPKTAPTGMMPVRRRGRRARTETHARPDGGGGGR